MSDLKNSFQYALKIESALLELFNEENENHITPEELEEDDNLTDFFHALCNIVPCAIYNKTTGDELDHLGFNHIANRLVFQYSKSKNEEI